MSFSSSQLVKEKTTNDIYAMKKIRKSGITTSQVREERDIMAMHKSEWITSLQYAFQDTDYLYLVMEYLPGGDLLSLMIRNGAFDEDLARFYLAELTLALNALHNMGYVHRDVKPENILLDRCGHLKLADFGNAAMLNKDGSVISLSPVGTPDYIAPELLQTLSTIKITKSVHDVTCDFWSMGIIGYELVTEVTPFHEENVHETYSKILCHSEESNSNTKLDYPSQVRVSNEFKNLIDHLVTSADRRFTYKKIVNHAFFRDINWSGLRDQVPPIIPSVSSDDDTSNFEDFERKGRRSTFLKKTTTPRKRNEFSGENLPFLGYSFVHQESILNSHDPTIDNQLLKLQTKIKDQNKTLVEQNIEIKSLQRDLMIKDKRVAEMSSSDKMMRENKLEMSNLKDMLKDKTRELASLKTEVKTLKSSLKIEEDQRLKSDHSIAEVLQSTYQKWEKAKKLSDQNYEKQIAEKKIEIQQLNEKLLMNESELNTQLTEGCHLQETVKNYKEMMRKSKDQLCSDRSEFEKSKQELVDSYEAKISELKRKLKEEKETRQKECDSLRHLKNELNESIHTRHSISDAKRSSDKTILEMRSRINQQIDENRLLREAKVAADKALADLQRNYNELTLQMSKLEENQQTLSNRSSLNDEMQFGSAKGSWQDLNAALLEEQLRNDLTTAKENEIKQRKRADDLEKMKERLEDAISKLEGSTAEGLLERQNTKLEDQLQKAREDAIVERQANRAANLSVWKLEKQIDELTAEKKLTARRVELMEQKCSKLKEEKQESEGKIKINLEVIASKDREIYKLQKEIDQLKDSVKKENEIWKQSEQERMKEKREIIEHISKVQKLEDLIEEGKRRLTSLQQKNESLVFENKRLLNERDMEQSELNQVSDNLQDYQIKHDNLSHNYNMLKEACNITEVQLTEMENLLDREMKRNEQAKAQIDDMMVKMKDKDAEMNKLRTELTEILSENKTLEHKYQQTQSDLVDAKDQLEKVATNLASQQESLIDKTSNLFTIQERLEVLTMETNNLEKTNDNYLREVDILKEENTKILSEYFMVKEEGQKVARDFKVAQMELQEQRQEIEHLNQILSEQKNYYVQRDIKSEATLAQHKKLIDYLQQKVEELTNKKKKSLVEKIFGSHDNEPAKKENVPPVINDTLAYKRMQEDLRRERCRNNQLKEKLLRTKSEIIKHQPTAPPSDEAPKVAETVPRSEPKKEEERFVRNDIGWSFKNAARKVTTSESSYGTANNGGAHRFELTLESPSISAQQLNCIACKNPILTSSTFLRCKECHSAIHRKCRNDVTGSCDGIEPAVASSLTTTGPSLEALDDVDGPRNLITTATIENSRKDYGGDFLFRPTDLSPPVFVHCIYEVNADCILVGCETGLYSYHYDTRSLVNIQGLDCVNYIEINTAINKAIFIASSQESLYQCDVRHLMTRSQASANSKPKLEAQILDLPFANRNSNERWHLVKISGDSSESTNDIMAIAATSSRIVIMKYDMTKSVFKPVRALDTATPVSNIFFTLHTAIVSSDKFFEIDMTTYTAEEFVDISQPSSGHLKNCRPMASFKISRNEFLLCFEEFGIYVDEYGCRSRSQEIEWTYTPTGFMFCNGILFISHFNMVQIMRIYRSPAHELSINYEDDESQMDGSSIENIKAFIPLSRPKLLNAAGKLNVFALVTLPDTEKQEAIIIDGMKSLRAMMSASVETLASSSNFQSSHCSLSSSTDTSQN